MTTDDTKDLLQEQYVLYISCFCPGGLPDTCTLYSVQYLTHVLYTVPNTCTVYIVQVTVFVVTTEFGEAALDTKQSRMRNSLVCKNSLLSEKKLSLGKSCMRNSLEAKQPCMRNSLVCETASYVKQTRLRNKFV